MTSLTNVNPSKGNAMVINTASLKGEDLLQLIQLNEEIESHRAQRASLGADGGALLGATMTSEELFESYSLDDDRFLTVLEYQNSYTSRSNVQVTDLDLSSTENLMKYIDEEVPVTPPKIAPMTSGKVASVIATFKSKAANHSPAHSPRKRGKQSGKNTHKKLEASTNILELKNKYEHQTNAAEMPVRQSLSKAHKFPMKVKELAQLFNAKITQVMRRNSDAIQRVAAVANTPVAKARHKLPTYRLPGLPSPAPSPRSRRRRNTPQSQKRNGNSTALSNACLVAEEVFRELSVKDKVLLFNKFISDMSEKHAEFSKHAEVIKANVKKQMACGEVINEKQATVKHLAQELEAKCMIDSPLQRVRSVKMKKRPIPPVYQVRKSNEVEDVLSFKHVAADSPKPDEALHVSTLTVVLRADLDSKQSAKQTVAQRLASRKSQELSLCDIEPSQKRNIQSLRSALPNDVFGPPKKIRRTRAERHQTNVFFQNEQLENLFYNWLKEENGVQFDITSTSNADELVEIANDVGDSLNTSGNSDGSTQMSTVKRLLEETIAKLEESKLNDSKVLPTSHKVKRQAPPPPEPQPLPTDLPVPAPRMSLLTQPKIISLPSSTAKQFEAEMSGSGLSTLAKPPENELQKSHDHNPAALSEHQLRVQASLQRLNIPEWFRQYNQSTARSPDGSGGGVVANNGATTAVGGTTTLGGGYKPGNFTRKRTQDSGRWTGLNSKTTSLSSLGSQRSDRSPLLLSPSAHSHHGGQSAVGTMHQHYSSSVAGGAGVGGTTGTSSGAGNFSRWSTSHLNSSQTSPSVSQRGSFARGVPINSSFISVASGNSGVLRNSYRQPYLGWRSTEKLSQRTPHERLASSLLAQQQHQRTSPTQRTAPPANGGMMSAPTKLQPPVTPEIQSSIKEVTSAIVHYVNDQTAQQQQAQRSRSTSPNSRKCWLESSFVGIRPLDSPQTPIIENNPSATAAFGGAAAAAAGTVHNNASGVGYFNATQPPLNFGTGAGFVAGAAAGASNIYNYQLTTGNTDATPQQPLRMNGLSRIGGGGASIERSLSNASLADVLASLLGLPTASTTTTTTTTTINNNNTTTTNRSSSISAPTAAGNVRSGSGTSTGSGAQARSTTGGSASEQNNPINQSRQTPNQLQVNINQAEQQRLRRRSEGDAPKQQQQQQQPHPHAKCTNSNTSTGGGGSELLASTAIATTTAPPPRRVSLGDSSESNNKTTTTTSAEQLQIRCRNTKCDNSATPADAKKFYKSCHNCTHLYCSRECRRAHWEKHRKACLHSRASNLCRQVLATCKDDTDSQRHLSLLARKGFLSQGRGVVRVLFRSAEAAEGFIKHGFQCMGEASYVRWPDLMPAEMGLELYSELLKLSTEYKPESKMLIYVAICVVSEAPGMGQAPVRWERQLVSRCAKLKLCKTIIAELELQQQALQQPVSVVAVPERTEILILTFNPSLRMSATNRELILSNILDILSRRGVLLRKHYPEIYQRLQTYTEGQTDKFNPVTLHPRDSQTGQSFVCIIMPVHHDSEIVKLPSAADGGNRVTTIDVGSPAALAQLDDDELLTRTTATATAS